MSDAKLKKEAERVRAELDRERDAAWAKHGSHVGAGDLIRLEGPQSNLAKLSSKYNLLVHEAKTNRGLTLKELAVKKKTPVKQPVAKSKSVRKADMDEEDQVMKDDAHDLIAEDIEMEEPFTVKPSAASIVKTYQHAKAEAEFLEDEIAKLDHPGIEEGLTKYKAKYVDPRMEHLKDLLHSHHGAEGEDADTLMDKCMKGMSTDGTGGSETDPGEAGMVQAGEIPDDDEMVSKQHVLKGRYKLVSAKGTRIVNGTEQQAIAAARKMEEELQPAFGVSVEDELGNTVANVEDGRVEKSVFKSGRRQRRKSIRKGEVRKGAYGDGYEAGMNSAKGRGLAKNPYEKGTQEWMDWIEGVDDGYNDVKNNAKKDFVEDEVVEETKSVSESEGEYWVEYDDGTRRGPFMSHEDAMAAEGGTEDKDLDLVEWAEQEEAEPEHEEVIDEEVGINPDEDTEEILERYQHPKNLKWYTRKVGTAKRVGNKLVLVKEAEFLEEKIIYGEDCEGEDQDDECLAMFANVGKGKKKSSDCKCSKEKDEDDDLSPEDMERLKQLTNRLKDYGFAV
jgi:hypothetical protein